MPDGQKRQILANQFSFTINDRSARVFNAISEMNQACLRGLHICKCMESSLILWKYGNYVITTLSADSEDTKEIALVLSQALRPRTLKPQRFRSRLHSSSNVLKRAVAIPVWEALSMMPSFWLLQR